MTTDSIFAFNISPPDAIWRWGAVPVSTGGWSPEFTALLRACGGRFEEHATRATFLLPEQFDDARRAVSRLRERGVEPVVHYATAKNPSRARIQTVDWYSVLNASGPASCRRRNPRRVCAGAA